MLLAERAPLGSLASLLEPGACLFPRLIQEKLFWYRKLLQNQNVALLCAGRPAAGPADPGWQVTSCSVTCSEVWPA